MAWCKGTILSRQMAQSGASSRDKLFLGDTSDEEDEVEFSRGMSAEDGLLADGDTSSDSVTGDPVLLEIGQSVKEGVAISRVEGVVGKGSLDPCPVCMISELSAIVSTTVVSDEGKT